MTTAQHDGIILMAMEVSKKEWKLEFSDRRRRRGKTVKAWDQGGLKGAIEKAAEKFGLPADTPVLSCYEAGRDGFSIDRFLKSLGVKNLVVDPGSIEAPKKRRAKTDRLDCKMLMRKLVQWLDGDREVWSVVKVPSVEQEDRRRLHREMGRLKKERTAHRGRIKSLLTLHGISGWPRTDYGQWLDDVRGWDGKALPAGAREELHRECARLELINVQLCELEKERDQRLKDPQGAAERKAAKLHGLRGIGPVGSWELTMEFFAWRDFSNRRQVGQMSGLTGTPYCSGGVEKERGLSKQGSKRVRCLAVELAWGWLRYQPQSQLAKWYEQRFGSGGKRMRRIGIAALARKLLIALWKYLETDQLPEGAVLSC